MKKEKAFNFNEKAMRYTCGTCGSFVGKNNIRCKLCGNLLNQSPVKDYYQNPLNTQAFLEESKNPNCCYYLSLNYTKFPRALNYFIEFSKKCGIPLSEVIVNYSVIGLREDVEKLKKFKEEKR